MLAVEALHAEKNYKKVRALKGVDLTVNQGEFFGLLGPNGAGKTTLIQSIVGLCRLNAGTVHVFGHDVVKDYLKSRRMIGYAPQEVNLDRFFSIEKILEFQAGFYGVSRAESKRVTAELLVRFNLSEKAKVQYYKLSGGMQKRVLVAKAMVNKPRLLILDEPTAGVDVEQRRELWRYLKELNRDGTTIILTTHYIDEAEILCERIGIIDLGQIKEMGTPMQLIQKYCKPRVRIRVSLDLDAGLFTNLKGFVHRVEGSVITGEGGRVGVMTEKILRIITTKTEASVEDITINKGDLEDVFLSVTGSQFAERAV